MLISNLQSESAVARGVATLDHALQLASLEALAVVVAALEALAVLVTMLEWMTVCVSVLVKTAGVLAEDQADQVLLPSLG